MESGIENQALALDQQFIVYRIATGLDLDAVPDTH